MVRNGLTQTVREIPGFLAFTAIFWIAWFREQTIAYVSLLVLGIGVALTGMVLLLALLVSRHPSPGQETILQPPPAPQPAT